MGLWRFTGAFTVAQRQGECGSKAAECTACPILTGSASQ